MLHGQGQNGEWSEEADEEEEGRRIRGARA